MVGSSFDLCGVDFPDCGFSRGLSENPSANCGLGKTFYLLNIMSAIMKDSWQVCTGTLTVCRYCGRYIVFDNVEGRVVAGLHNVPLSIASIEQ